VKAEAGRRPAAPTKPAKPERPERPARGDEGRTRGLPAQAQPPADESADPAEVAQDGESDLAGAVFGAVQPLVQPLVKPKRRPWIPRVAGIACYLIGLLDIVYALFPGFRNTKQIKSVSAHDVTHFVPGLEINPYGIAASMIVGVLLVLLAHGLRRRKHRAWMGVVGLLGLTILTHLVALAGHFIPRSTGNGEFFSVVLLVLLIVYRNEFYALSDPRSRWRAIWVFCCLLIVDLGLGLLIVSVRPQEIIDGGSVFDKVEQVLLGLVGVSGPMDFRVDRYSDYVYYSLLGLSLLTLLVTLYLFLRPAAPEALLTPVQETEVRALLAKHGHRDSLGYFALRRDKAVLFSPSGKACIAYRVVAGVMLASGDPVGDPEAWPGAIKAFCDRADKYAWIPAVMGCSELGGEIWCREAGMDALELGDEAVVEVADFSLDGRAMRNVRQMVNKIERKGYVCETRRLRDIPETEIVAIRRLANDGRSTETERGFSMALGRFGDPSDGDCVVVTASQEGEIRAVLNFVPWGRDGLSLDLMRRDRTADPGLNELMIVAALREAGRLGVARISLNFAVFRSALERGERIGAGPVLRRWRGLLVFLSRWFQIESLYRFNVKFRPIWEPRFVVFRQTRDMPRIALAALEAEAFLVLPSLLQRGSRQQAEPAALSAASEAG